MIQFGNNQKTTNMKKVIISSIYCCLFLCFLNSEISAQSTTRSWQWAKRPDIEVAPYTNPSVSTDSYGNIYVVGGFVGTATFATSPAPTILTSAGEADIFIAKYDPSGNVIWAKRAGGTRGDIANAVQYDGFGNIYVVGYFIENTDFDGTVITNSVTGAPNVFIAKFNASNGNFLWVRQGAAGSPYTDQKAFDVAVDNNGDAYVTGYFGIVTFDGLPTMNTVGWWDLFVVKYNSSGTAQWQTAVGSTEAGYYAEGGRGIAVDQSGNVFVTGNINGSSAYPTNFGTIPVGSNGGGGFYEYGYFLAKYVPSTSTWDWAVTGGGAGNDIGNDVSLDANGNAYVSGFYSGTATFGSSTFTSTGDKDYFIAKYSPDGNLSWVHSVSGIGFFDGNSSKADVNGNLYFAGTFDGTIIVGSETLNSNGFDNSYVTCWTNNGDLQWIKHVPGDYYAHVRGIDLGTNGEVHFACVFAGNQTFDCTVLSSTSFTSLAIAKLGITGNGPEAPTVAASSNPVCPGSSTTLSIVSGNLNNATAWKWYTGSCGGTLVGTGNSITVTPSVATTYYVRGEGGCSAPGACASITINIGILNVTIPDVKALNYNSILNNTVYPAYGPASSITLSAQALGASPYSYNWSNGATAQSIIVSPTSTTTYTVTVTDANGCIGTASKEITVKNVNCGNGKIYMCHIAGNSGHINTICIGNNAVASHLGHGCSLGQCVAGRPTQTITVIEAQKFSFQILPNPGKNFIMIIKSSDNSPISIKVMDIHGRAIEQRTNVKSGDLILANGYSAGVYIAEIIQGSNRKIMKFIKE